MEDTVSDTLPLIVTKIRVPRRRQDLLPRHRLVSFIHSHLDRKLLLVSAPAGYGKTSLMTDFAHDTDLSVCWYTLDTFDRDLHIFLEYLIASIARRFPSFGERSRAQLRDTTDPGSNLYPIVATMVQEIYDTIPEYFFLVLDDHHTVDDQEQINEFLDLFATYVDENCHLIIASRTLPALPSLSLLVARRQAAGLSIDELRFTPQEIRALAQQNYHIDLSLEQASRLAERTGGWITGLLLTAAPRWEQSQSQVAVQGRVNVNLYDYLSRQVLERQPDPLREFLLDSSVLDELSADLCASVLQVADPTALMDQVRARNLFFIEYGEGDGRLRYHDLFREFLQTSLRQQNEGRFRDLTLSAAGAYAERGEWERAVSRYLALQRYEPVVGIIQRTGANLFQTGRWDTLASWIDALPEAKRAAHPRILIHRGQIHMERGEYPQAQALWEQAEEAFVAEDDKTGRAYALAMKGYVLRVQGRYTEAIERCREALQLLTDATEEERIHQAMTLRNVGLCYYRQGRSTEGREAFRQALDLYDTMDRPLDAGLIHHDLGLARELQGDLEGAVEHYQSALEHWQQLENPGPWANTLNGLGVVYYLQGRYDEAAHTLDEALAKAQLAGDRRVEAFVWASLGDLRSDQGLYNAARQAFAQALELATRADVGFILTYAQNALGNVYRLQGDLVQAREQLQKAMDLATKHLADYEIGLCHTSLGSLAGAEEDLDQARAHLDQAIDLFETGGFNRDLALACLHRAQIAFQAEDREDALSNLERTLDLLGSLSSDQFFVIEGQHLLDLLRFAAAQPSEDETLSRLLDRIEAHQEWVAARPEPVVRVEPQPKLRVYALGQPLVELGGQSIRWTTAQSRDLFFCLLQHPQGLRKEEVGGIFWPDHPPHKLDGIFRSTLYRLRRAVSRDSVVYEDGLYYFKRKGDYWFDVEAFELMLSRAKQAATPEEQIELLEDGLSLYKGDYLDGVYADWSALERERLRELQLNALESLAGLWIGWGDLHRAVKAYQDLVSQDPYRESAHRELMWCHYRLGDRITAIRQYQSCVQILRDDLGLSPSPETEALYLQIIG